MTSWEEIKKNYNLVHHKPEKCKYEFGDTVYACVAYDLHGDDIIKWLNKVARGSVKLGEHKVVLCSGIVKGYAQQKYEHINEDDSMYVIEVTKIIFSNEPLCGIHEGDLQTFHYTWIDESGDFCMENLPEGKAINPVFIFR
jgi:hypothetical protein